MPVFRKLFPCLLTLLIVSPVLARRDPLNNAEIDQLREAAQEPNNRLKLLVKFARARLQSLDQVRTDPKLSPDDRAAQIHDLLQDFTSIYDELDDNLDTYSDQKADFRKALHVIIESDADFQNRLKAFRDAVDAAPVKNETKQYYFVLQTAMDAVNDDIGDHQKLLDEQNQLAHAKKKH